MERIKAWASFVWNWITVLVTGSLGLLVFLLQVADFIGGFELSPFFGPEKALAISTAVAIVKGALTAVIGWAQARASA